MSHAEIEKGRRYFCREETSGDGYCGLFHIDDDGISARLVSIEKRFVVQASDVLVLRLENNRFASLHDNISSPGESAHDTREPKMATYAQSVISNMAIVGRSPWLTDAPIRRAQFSIEHGEDLLLHPPKFDAIADAEFGIVDDTKIFEVEAAGIKVAAWYALSGTLHLKRPTKIEARYTVEFDQPRNLHNYLDAVQCVVRFVSAALGKQLIPSEIQVSALNYPELLAAIEGKNYLGDHDVHYIWRGDIPKKRDLWVGHSFVHARDEDELKALAACLTTWIDREAVWHNATVLMMRSFKLDREMSADRLLTACKWLEEIPGAASEIVVSDEDIEKIAAVAASEADRLGHGEFESRIAGVIRGQLKSETNGERFARLKAAVCARFGVKAMDDEIVAHLRAAMAFRGKVAHGHFDPEDEAEYRTFAKAVYAVEALCYLLTIKDLPMTDAGAQRAIGREVAANYRHFSA